MRAYINKTGLDLGGTPGGPHKTEGQRKRNADLWTLKNMCVLEAEGVKDSLMFSILSINNVQFKSVM